MPVPGNLADSPPELAAERRHRQERLAGALRIFGRLGFGEGVAGHITARDPEWPDHFWVNPFAMSFNRVRVRDLLLVNHAGEVVHGERPVNRAAFVLHAAIHNMTSELNHSHASQCLRVLVPHVAVRVMRQSQPQCLSKCTGDDCPPTF